MKPPHLFVPPLMPCFDWKLDTLKRYTFLHTLQIKCFSIISVLNAYEGIQFLCRSLEIKEAFMHSISSLVVIFSFHKKWKCAEEFLKYFHLSDALKGWH